MLCDEKQIVGPKRTSKVRIYSDTFARVYDAKWSTFAQRFGLRIDEFYRATGIGKENKAVLDLCCGTGQLALYFLNHGYSVVGLDLSPNMLKYAEEHSRDYVKSGCARFVVADASVVRRK